MNVTQYARVYKYMFVSMSARPAREHSYASDHAQIGIAIVAFIDVRAI